MASQDRKRAKLNKYRPFEVSFRITFIYLICGALWILFSDHALSTLVKDKDKFAYFSVIKGWFYIAMTALLLFFLIYKVTRRMSAAERKLHNQYIELHDNREKLRQVAFRDQLTGLPNRLALYENLTMLKDASLLYVDLDDFKYINDTLGHAFGDRLIGVISERLTEGLQSGEQLYRLGGDEWVLVCREPAERLQKRGEELLQLFEKHYLAGEHRMHLTVSVGIARFPAHGRTLEELLINADIALYEVKKQGKNSFTMYNPSLRVPVQHRANMERLLRNAVDNGEFELYYQPQINLESGKVAGVEALIRWNSPELGRVQPDQFIRIAEETQLIIPIGEWVLRKACEFIRSIHEKEGSEQTVSVNVSVVQLVGHRFVERVLEIFKETGVNPSCVELEVTESMVIESLDRIGDKLSRLKEVGISIALDDFGRGFSSLTHLMKLPISTLKIDKSFIDQVPEAREDQPLTGLIIQLAKAMGIKVVAEGVESYAQLEYLKKHGCDCIQGYLFSKPIPALEAKEWIKTGRKSRVS
ncbi:putative bifunctional diguanylate cyclase/phosphodiesterase [Cohnella sp.]|uniref:putative bifunctional diguanylate cyclase/phosphodiesterase n=1 Tax=Cohnella sp. TaxID=1883426 RepID=UPI00356231A4